VLPVPQPWSRRAAAVEAPPRRAWIPCSPWRSAAVGACRRNPLSLPPAPAAAGARAGRRLADFAPWPRHHGRGSRPPLAGPHRSPLPPLAGARRRLRPPTLVVPSPSRRSSPDPSPSRRSSSSSRRGRCRPGRRRHAPALGCTTPLPARVLPLGGAEGSDAHPGKRKRKGGGEVEELSDKWGPRGSEGSLDRPK